MAKKKNIDIELAEVQVEFTKTIFDGKGKEYRKGDKLTLPAEEADRLKKYIKEL